jgi:hypothetical protein
MSIARSPYLFANWVLLALAVLLALGLRRVMARVGRGGRATGALLGLSGLLVLEGASIPLPVPDRPVVSTCYQMLADDPRPGAVLDLPVVDLSEPMYYQTVHGRPVAAGRFSRRPPYPFLYGTPVLVQLARADRRPPRDIYLPAPGPGTQAYVAGWGVNWLMLRLPEIADQPYEEALRAQLGELAPACADAAGQLYYLEPRPAVMALGQGWYDLESQRDGSRFRWMKSEASMTVYAPTSGQVELVVTGWAHQQNRALEVWRGAERQADLRVPTGQSSQQTALLTLPAGRSILHLRASEPPTRAGVADDRLLSVAVLSLQVRWPITAARDHP